MIINFVYLNYIQINSKVSSACCYVGRQTKGKANRIAKENQFFNWLMKLMISQKLSKIRMKAFIAEGDYSKGEKAAQ
jgi:hypothetical protein